MNNLKGALCAAAIAVAANAPAHAATIVTYTAYASGHGIYGHYKDGNPASNIFIQEVLKGATFTFTLPLFGEQNVAFGGIDAGVFSISATTRGLGFSYDTSPNPYIPGAVTGGGSACFSNPSGTFPAGGIKLVGGDGCGRISYLKQGKYSYEDFTGTITSIHVDVTEGLDAATASIAGYVPEPSSWALMLAGFGMMGVALRYRGRQTKVVYA